MPTAPNIVDLRRMLAERFPAAHVARGTGTSREAIATGVPALDRLLGGGLAKGELTELVGEGPGSGTAQVVHAILARAEAEGRFLALVDGADSFDVDAPTPEALARLLWVRCRTAEEALKATDLLTRDRNFPLVILDLQFNPASQLRRVPSNIWHRFGRIVEQHGTALLVVTPFPLVGGVSVRVEARARLGLEALTATPGELAALLRFELVRVAGAGSTGESPVVEAQAG